MHLVIVRALQELLMLKMMSEDDARRGVLRQCQQSTVRCTLRIYGMIHLALIPCNTHELSQQKVSFIFIDRRHCPQSTLQKLLQVG
jgi:hypothetical protein